MSARSRRRRRARRRIAPVLYMRDALYPWWEHEVLLHPSTYTDLEAYARGGT